MGTIAYCCPEIFNRVETLTFVVDIWSAGCVLFEMLKLKKAYDGPNFHDISTNIIDSDAPRLDSTSLVFKPILTA